MTEIQAPDRKVESGPGLTRNLAEPLETRECDPFLKWVWNLKSSDPTLDDPPKGLSSRWLILLGPVIVLMLVVVTALLGTLAHPQGLSILEQDIRSLTGGPAAEDAYFPLMRDLPSLFIALIIGPQLAVLLWQWKIMESFTGRLIKAGVLEVDDDPIARPPWRRVFFWRPHVSRRAPEFYGLLNQAMKRPWGRVFSISAGALALLVVFAEATGGVFGGLSPDSSEAAKEAFAHEAYAAWWARVDASNPFGFTAYFALITFGIYYVLVLNWVGIRFTYFWWEVRSRIKCKLILVNVDGYYGWLPFRRLLQSVFASIAISALALTLLFLIVPTHQAKWVLPLLLIFIVLNPIYTITPIVLLRTRNKAAKREAVNTLLGLLHSHAQVNANMSAEEIDATKSMRLLVDEVQAQPTTPFRTRQMVFWMAVYLAPVITVILQATAILGWDLWR